MKLFFATLIMALGLGLTASAQCSVPVLSGCVGNCGASYTATYVVTPADVFPTGVAIFCLRATSTSLCPSDDAIGTLRRNLGPIRTGRLDEGDILKVKAVAGDVLSVTVTDVVVDPSIACFWLGETYFELAR
jgi:hypothetical protein